VFVPPEPPKIIQGEVLRTTAAMSVELICESHGGKPPAELTWLDGDNNPITSGVEYQTQLLSDGKRANAALKLTFQPTRLHDGRTLTCRSENPALREPQRAFIRLEVKYAPEVTLIVDNNAHVVEGSDVRFECEARANPSSVVYKWYNNDEVIIGDHMTSLTLTKVTRDMNGAAITCEVTNAIGTTKAKHELNIHYGPVVKTPLESVVGAELGREVRLTCDVDGNPKPDIIWLFEGSPLVQSTDAQLVIREMTHEKTGKYICRASVPGFKEVSASTFVFIKGPPRIASSQTQFGAEGDLVKVECLVHSVPPPTRILWSHNGRDVHVDNNAGYEIVEERSESLTRNVLLIRRSKDSDFGLYNCTVWNSFGVDSIVISLARQKSFPMLIIVAAIIGGVVLVVSLTIIVILLMKRKHHLDGDDDDDYCSSSDVKKPTTSKTLDSGSSGADSDLKVDIRTSSSLSHEAPPLVGQSHYGWDDAAAAETHNEIARVVDNIYTYTRQANSEFPPKEPGNNNGYVAYLDYSRDYLPPPPQTVLVTSAIDGNAYSLEPHYGTIIDRDIERDTRILICARRQT